MTLAEISGAMGGTLVRSSDREVLGFSIDTRTAKPGDLFFAIRGDRFDGHAFVSDAVESGAVGAVIDDTSTLDPLPDAALIAVNDTVAGLQRLAGHIRRESGTTVVAVTGSAGKSTTKEITAEFLATRFRVFRNEGNLNNHIGLPLSLLELRHRPEVAVVELGMNHFGEISTLVKIAEPNVRVWTNVGPAHLEFFGSIDAIADAKAEILEGARKDDVLVANADDERVMRYASGFAGRVWTFGIERDAEVRAVSVIDRGVDGTSATVRTPRGNAELHTPLPGTANLSNVLAATAVALSLDVPLGAIVARAGTLRPVAHRGEIVRAGLVTIVDDSYNSNPKALSRALLMVGGETRFARRIAVIGEMLELGPDSAELHRQAGVECATAGIDVVIAVGGPAARHVADGALQAGMPDDHVQYAADSRQAADLAVALVKPRDLVLVKGSRGIKTEIVVDRLKAAFA